MKRREFLKTTAALAALAGSADLLKAGNAAEKSGNQPPVPDTENAGGPLLASHPVLQNYAPTSMGVAFAVSALANGYVLYGREPDLSDAVKVKCGGFRVTDIGRITSMMCPSGDSVWSSFRFESISANGPSFPQPAVATLLRESASPLRLPSGVAAVRFPKDMSK